MKSITFRPLRKIKKTGKIVVASYMQWRKIKTADYSIFKLIVDTEYKTLPPDEYVFNHEGKNLFWRDYNPEDIPTLPYVDSYSFEEEDVRSRQYPSPLPQAPSLSTTKTKNAQPTAPNYFSDK